MSTSDSSSIRMYLDRLRNISVDRGAYDLDPRVVSGWVDMCLGALDVLVKAKRGKHADDKALEQTIETHLEHARDHMDQAGSASIIDNVSGGYGLTGLDDDALPHFNHATARVALLYARQAIVENEKRLSLARDKIRGIKERLNVDREKRSEVMDAIFSREIHRAIPGESVTKPRVVIGLDGADTYPVETVSDRGQAEGLLGKWCVLAELFEKPKVFISANAGDALERMERISSLAADLYIKRRYPNSCEVDKAERGRLIGTVCGYSLGTFNAYMYSDGIRHMPTRKIETENSPGKGTASCVDGPERRPIGVALGDANKDGTVLVKLSSANSIGATAKRDVYAGECVTTNDVEFGVESVSGVDGGAWSPLIPIHISAPHARQLSGQCHGCAFAKYSGGPGYDTVRCNGCKGKWDRPGYEAKK